MWTLKLCLVFGLLASTAVIADEQPFRNFMASVNSGCRDPICNRTSPEVLSKSKMHGVKFRQLPNVLYIRGSLAEPVNGINDTLHIVFSTMGGFPAVLVVHCNKSNDPLHFDWKHLLNDTLKFSGISAPKSCQNEYAFAVVALSAVDFNDTFDEVKLSTAAPNETAVVRLDRLGWMRISNWSEPNVIQVRSDPVLDNGTYFSHNGSLNFRLSVGTAVGMRPSELPHLEFSGNSVQVDTVFDSWLSQFDNTRLAVEMMLISREANGDGARWYASKSIDDEYTPGTFTLDNWITRQSQYAALQDASPNALNIQNGYVQYKPIAYTLPNEYSVQNTVTVNADDLNTDYSQLTALERVHDALRSSVIAAYFDTTQCELSKCPGFSLSAVNVTFGQVGDGFYKKTAWLKWTAQIGFGVPPQDAVSALVILIILTGLGFPIVLMAIGGIYFAIRRCRANRIGYQRIN